MKKFAKNEFFKIFVSFLMGSIFSKLKIFENFYIQPPNFISFTCSKHPKWKLHEGLIPLTPSQTTRQAFKVAVGGFRPPPGSFRVKNGISEEVGDLHDYLEGM